MTPFLDGNGVVPFNETGNAEVSLQKRNYEFRKCYLIFSIPTQSLLGGSGSSHCSSKIVI